MNNYKKGDIVTGKVTGIKDYGVFLSLDDGTSGLIHISEISDSFVRNINDYVNINEVIKAEVCDYDSSSNRLKLSIKNIDYRLSKVNKSRIVETKSAFSTLKSKLNSWIDMKLNEEKND